MESDATRDGEPIRNTVVSAVPSRISGLFCAMSNDGRKIVAKSDAILNFILIP
jgi:hypothetical protein